MVRTIVSGVVHEIRSAADRGVTLTCLQPTFGTEDEPGVSVPKNGGDERTSGADMRRIHKNDGHSTSSRSRSASPGKRKSIAQDGYDDGFPSYEDGLSPEDGLSVLLRACEILGNSSNDQNTRQENTVHSGARDADSSPRKQVKSPAQSPQKASRNASPTRNRHEKPHGPCTNKHCLNPNESPQWRRGPPEAPILCNACGTRWLRSKQLIPIMVRQLLHCCIYVIHRGDLIFLYFTNAASARYPIRQIWGKESKESSCLSCEKGRTSPRWNRNTKTRTTR